MVHNMNFINKRFLLYQLNLYGIPFSYGTLSTIVTFLAKMYVMVLIPLFNGCSCISCHHVNYLHRCYCKHHHNLHAEQYTVQCRVTRMRKRGLHIKNIDLCTTDPENKYIIYICF